MSQYNNPNPPYLRLIADLVPNPLPAIPSWESQLRYYGPEARSFCEAFLASLVSRDIDGKSGRAIKVVVASERKNGQQYGDVELWVTDSIIAHLRYQLWKFGTQYEWELRKLVKSFGGEAVKLSPKGRSLIVTCYLRRIGNQSWQRARIYIQPIGGLVKIG